jgi:glycine/D-amino acid oxidase-like deaminating enzyme/nitrite reductase/ring-hydroxylating ferredoxin subunit
MRNESFWLASSSRTEYPRLDSDLHVEVAVVGAGIAGLTTALLLSEAGLDVAVLEAGRVGAGVTGHTTGKLTAAQGLAYSRLERAYGADAARLYARSQAAAVERVFELAERHAIACDLERATNYVFAEREDELEALHTEAAAARNAGLGAELVERIDLPVPALAAVRLEGQGQFHARKYLLGVADAFVSSGGRIFERTRVQSVDSAGSPGRMKLALDGLRVDADQVVLATHVPVTMKGWFFARVHPHAAYAVAAPVADDRLEGMWINIGSPTRSLRTTPLEGGGRLLIVVGENHRVGQEDNTSARYEALADYLTAHFPETNPSYRWSTHDQYPVDGLPYIGRLDEEALYVATGFAGWGLSNGTVAGLVISDAILGRDNEWASLFDPGRSSLVRAPGSMLAANLEVAKQLLAGKLRARPESFDAVAVGSGQVVTVDGEKVAAYRDRDGSIVAVGASCTHLGCDVAWNDAERTWDCPCHGSRFAVSGEVIEGPAVEPLRTVKLSP